MGGPGPCSGRGPGDRGSHWYQGGADSVGSRTGADCEGSRAGAGAV